MPRAGRVRWGGYRVPATIYCFRPWTQGLAKAKTQPEKRRSVDVSAPHVVRPRCGPVCNAAGRTCARNTASSRHIVQDGPNIRAPSPHYKARFVHISVAPNLKGNQDATSPPLTTKAISTQPIRDAHKPWRHSRRDPLETDDGLQLQAAITRRARRLRHSSGHRWKALALSFPTVPR